MSNATYFKNSFAHGEVSPFVYQSGSDLQVSQGCLTQCHNYIPLRTRALIRRQGTKAYHIFDSEDTPQRIVSFVVDQMLSYLIGENLYSFLRGKTISLKRKRRFLPLIRKLKRELWVLLNIRIRCGLFTPVIFPIN